MYYLVAKVGAMDGPTAWLIWCLHRVAMVVVMAYCLVAMVVATITHSLFVIPLRSLQFFLRPFLLPRLPLHPDFCQVLLVPAAQGGPIGEGGKLGELLEEGREAGDSTWLAARGQDWGRGQAWETPRGWESHYT